MPKIKKDSRTIVIALILGQGRIINNTLVLKHDDKNYLVYIRFLLKKHGINVTNVIDFHNIDPADFTNSKIEDFATNDEELEQISNRDFSKLPRYGIRTYKHKFMGIYRCMTYGGKIKKRWFNRFSQLHLAVWYMEIGSIINGELVLKTMTTEDYNQIIINWLLDEWGLIFYQRLNEDKYILYCRENTAKKFCNIIEPYVCPSMKYKLIL